MKINNIKDLQKIIALCRKSGVEAIEIDNVKLNLGPEPRKIRRVLEVANDIPEANLKIPQYNPHTGGEAAEFFDDTELETSDVIKTNELTEEQLLFYSAREEITEDNQKGQ
jgi:hypothetical protein